MAKIDECGITNVKNKVLKNFGFTTSEAPIFYHCRTMSIRPIKIIVLALSFLLSISFSSTTQAQDANFTNKLPAIKRDASSWADSVYSELSMEQRIGQLFMVAAYSGTAKYNENVIQNLIRSHHIGGLIFMQGTAKKQAELTNKFQNLSNVPLLIGMDAEWGLGMRLKGIKDLPKQMFLGAANDKKLMYKYGQFVAAQCKRLGVHVNFAPVIDVNNNPKNPVINFRSFGENKELVSRLGVEYMRGLQQNGVMACAKHFPGHGDTDVDSHKDLPTIKKSKRELQQVEFYPFQELFSRGIQSVMIAHLNIPSLEANNVPTTLSKSVVTDLLRGEMRFNGLIFTDALNMKGVTKYYSPGEVDYLAFKAGNDVLLFSENVAVGVSKIKEAIKNGQLTEARLEASVKRILIAKHNAGLNKFKTIETKNIDNEINDLTHVLRQETAQKGSTLLSDPYNVLDKIRKKENNKIAYVFVGTSSHPNFTSDLKRARINNIFFARTSSPKAVNSLKEKLKNYDAVVVGVHNMSLYPGNNYGLDQGELNAIKTFAKNKNTLNVIFGNPYAIDKMQTDAGYLVCYDEHDESLETALKILTSQMTAKGKLPVSVTSKYQFNAGIASTTNSLGQEVVVIDKNDEFAKRWKAKNGSTTTANNSGKVVTCCVNPEAVGANINYLNKVDALMNSAIRQCAFPGCRVMAIKDGKVFYDRNFGYNTYNKKVHVENTTLYDIASITKIAATNMAVMKLYDEGRLKLNGTLGEYLPWTRRSNKRNVKIKDLLLHQGGLHAWIPFYKETLDDNGYPKKSIYQTRPSAQYNLQVCNGLYMKKQWADTMWKRILDSKMTNLGRYKYSDLDFIFLQKVVEKITGMPLDKYVAQTFYEPLGMEQTFFNPKRQAVKGQIAPSEYDKYFRHKKIKGYVHDMGAAMFGGVSGHAGLFSTAKDLSILMQMLLNEGSYNGKQYLKPSTIKLFTAKNSFLSRRGLGFDKPQPNKNKAQPTSTNCSLATFGHTGFTGTCVWADPVHNIQFIFLSNRTYPSADNWKINKLDVREKAQEYIYKSFGIISR